MAALSAALTVLALKHLPVSVVLKLSGWSQNMSLSKKGIFYTMGGICSGSGENVEEAAIEIEQQIRISENPYMDPSDPETMRKLIIVRALLKKNEQSAGTPSISRDGSKNTINLALSCRNNSNTKELEHMLKNFATLDLNQFYEGKSAIFWACSHGNLATVKLLLSQDKLNPNLGYIQLQNITHGKHFSPLYEAVSKGEVEIVQELINCPRVDVNLGHSLLLVKVFESHVGELGMDIEKQNIHSDLLFLSERTPLFVSLEMGKKMISSILMRSEFVDIRRGRVAPIHILSRLGDISTFRNIIKKSQHGIVGDDDGKGEMIELLNQRIKGVVSKTNDEKDWVSGSTPLHIACSFDQEKFADELLSFDGIDIEAKDGLGRNSFELAKSVAVKRKLKNIMEKRKEV